MSDEVLQEAFGKVSDGGTAKMERVPEVLKEVGVEVPEDLDQILASVVPEQAEISLLDLKAVVKVLQRKSLVPELSQPATTTPRRTYLENGMLTEDETVLSFIRALEEHKKKCEREQKYTEARVTATRLLDLKAREAETRRKQMAERQTMEREEAEKAFEHEKEQQGELWDTRIQEYEAGVLERMERLKVAHEAQLAEFHETQETQRPRRPQYSKELLNQRKITECLAKLEEYEKAEKLKEVTDQMERAEMQATQATFDANVALRLQRLMLKQKNEADGLQQKATQGRRELDLSWRQDIKRREQRFKNVLSELANLQKLEQVQLEHFLQQQAIAGKRQSDKKGGAGLKGLSGGRMLLA